MELISVIIPVYNTAEYLPQCLDSVLDNTYRHLEIICIDDGSLDNCPEICDEYAQKDSRITVIHQKNQGLCAARNAGLKIATGDYVAFVDSDDVVSPFLYEELVKAIQSENADWAACEYTRKQDTLPVDALPNPGNIHVVEGMKSLLSVLVCAPSMRNTTWTGAYVWNKLYRKEAITEPFRIGCVHSEDLLFNWNYLKNDSKLAIVSLDLYFYRVNEKSITETYRKATADKLAQLSLSLAQVNEEISAQVPAQYTEIKQYMIARTVNVMHGALFRMYAHNIAKQHPDFCRHAGRYIRKHWKTVWKEKETYSLRAKLLVLLFAFAYPIWVLATKIFKA